MNLIYIPITAILLITAQSFWNKAVKADGFFNGATLEILRRMLTSPSLWIGGVLYIIATLVYLLALSKNNFFVVQASMTGLALVFSTLVAVLFFGEKISVINIAGILVIFLGALMVVQR